MAYDPLEQDEPYAAYPPAHDRLRRVVRERFTPATIAAMPSPPARTAAASVARTSARMAGCSRRNARLPRLPQRGAGVLGAQPVRGRPARGTAVAVLVERGGCEPRRHAVAHRAPGTSSLLADVVAAEGRGELSADEIPGLCLLLYIAGTETVADFIGNALVALAGHREQRALLAAQPQRSAAAVEELLRFESPVQYQVRTAAAETELHGVAIPAGSAVALLWGAANRDEGRWERPDELNLTREPRRHLAFGEGIHHCLGAPLARLQGRVVLEETLRAMPGYRLAGEPERIATHNTRGVARLAILPA